MRDGPQPDGPDPETILCVHEALVRLQESDPVSADVVKLHFFVGMTLDETADALGMSRATVFRHWSYARAMLRLALREIGGDLTS